MAVVQDHSIMRWLLFQMDQAGFLCQLAQATRGDFGFLRDGDAEAVRKRLNTLGAHPDMREAVYYAELEWSSI